MQQEIFFFGGGKADGNGGMKDVLGGKGAGLAEMTNAGVPVPPGFTISTRVCIAYQKEGRVPATVQTEQDRYIERLEKLLGKKLGDPADPLLVSVRSGAKFSMPGMMDTILNLGLNDKSVQGLAAKTGNERFAWDCYRRFISMFSDVVLDISKRRFEEELSALKKERGVKLDLDLGAEDLKELVARFRAMMKETSGSGLPAGSAGAARHVPRRGLPLLEQPSRDLLSPAEQDPGRSRHRGERAGDGVRQHGTDRRPPAWASPATPQAASRSSTASTSPTRRARTWWRASARRSRSSSSARRCRRPTSSCARSPTTWRSTTRTSRISSSPSRTARSTCSRPAPASAPAPPR